MATKPKLYKVKTGFDYPDPARPEDELRAEVGDRIPEADIPESSLAFLKRVGAIEPYVEKKKKTPAKGRK